MVDVRNFFQEVLPKKLASNPEIASSIGGTYQFSLGDAGEWIVDLSKDGGEVREGSLDDAKCVVTAKADTFAKLLEKPQSAPMLFMTGKLKVSNVSRGMALQKLLG